MKCEKCGGNLTLEDVVCPYCDALNEHAVEHIREMNRYKREFEGTKKQVYTVTNRYVGIAVRIIIIAILVILIVVCGLLSGEGYSFKRNIAKAQSRRNAVEYSALIEQYLDDRDYYALAVFCEEKYIDTYEENFEEYSCIIYGAKYYSYLYENIMRVAQPSERAAIQNNIKWITDYLNDFYKIFDESGTYYYSIGDSAKSREAAEEMEEQILALLMAYCGLTKEDADSLRDMTDAQRAIIIEERILNAK